MTNPYIDMLQAAPAAAPGGEPPANPYLDMLQSADEQRRQQMAGQLTQAVGVNPEQYTAQRRVAQYLGYPTPVVEAQPHLMGQAKVRQIQQDTANAPVLQRKYTDADFAKLAHDDAPILSKIETAVSSAVRYAMGADQYGGMWGDLKRGAWDNSVIGTAGAFRMVSELGASAAELVPAVRSLEASGQYGGNPLRRLAEGFAMIGANQQALKDASSPPAEGNIAGGVSSGFQSAGQNLKYLPLAFLGPAGWAAGLTGMVVESGGTTYQKDREDGVPMGTATIHAAADGLAEYVGERYFGEVGFLKRLAAGAPATKLLMWEITRDVPGEIGTTLWQNFNDWALTNPSKTADQFLREQPDAIVQTAIGALVGGGVQVGVGKLAMRTAETVLNRQMEVTETLQREESLKALMQLAGQAKLAERSPEQLQAFVAEASGDATVRFDAATLVDVFKQDANALAQALPSVDLQALQEAAATGGEVTVPLAELVVGVKAAGVDQTVLEHARLGDSTLSAAEARDVQSRMDGELGAQVAQAIAQAQDQDAARQSHEAVRSNIEQQITATGRHRPAVAEQMATWAASFFTTYGSRLGITAEEMFQRYPLRAFNSETFAKVRQERVNLLRRFASAARTAGARTLNDQAVAPQPNVDRAGLDAEDIGDLREGDTGAVEQGGGVNRPALLAMYSEMRRAVLQDDKVLGTIIRTLPIKVVNDLAGTQAAAERLLRDNPMFKDGPAIDADLAVAEAVDATDAVGLLLREVARRAAVADGRALGAGMEAGEGSAAVGAGQGDSLDQGKPFQARATIDPTTLEIVFNPNTNLSSFFHEVGHFFLEVLADVASQPNAPAQIVGDMNTFLKWAGITGDESVGGPDAGGELAQGAGGGLWHGSFDPSWIDRGEAFDANRPANAPSKYLFLSPRRDVAETYAGVSEMQRWKAENGMGRAAPATAGVREFQMAKGTKVLKVKDVKTAAAKLGVQWEGENPLEALLDAAKAGGYDAVQLVMDGGNIAVLNPSKFTKKSDQDGERAARYEQQRAKLNAQLAGRKRGLTHSDIEEIFPALPEDDLAQDGQPAASAPPITPKRVGGPDAGGELAQADDRDTVYKEIAADEEVVEALEAWMVDGAPPNKPVNDKLLAYMRRLPPVPSDSYLTFYRGQPRGVSPHPRGWASWTTNKDETRFFTEGNGEVLTRKGVRGISLEEVALWRTRATGQLHDYGSQGEWLVLNESVFNQDGQPAASAPPITPKRVGGPDAGGELAQAAAPAGVLTGDDGKPLVLYHGTNADIQKFDAGMADTGAGQSEGATWFSSSPVVTERFGAATMPVYLTAANVFEVTPQNMRDLLPVFGGGMTVVIDGRPVTADINREAMVDGREANVLDLLASGRAQPVMDADVRKRAVAAAKKTGADAVVFRGFYDASDTPSDIYAVFDPKQIVSAISGEVLGQEGQPATTQPITPKRTPLETWNAMTLDQKRPYHERWAESIEQYVMEGRAPSVELQPLMRRFATWLKSVYGSIKAFLASRGVAPAGGETLGQAQPEVTRVLYRGTTGSTERIKGGIAEGTLFAAADEGTARSYAGSGGAVEQIGVRPGAKILVEGSAEFAKVTGRKRGKLINTMRKGENLKTAADAAAEQARAAGYDAVEFTSMRDLGIAIFNESAFVRDLYGTSTVQVGENLLQPGGEVLGQAARPVAAEAFKRWFGKSKVVDAEGKPLVVYHGSPKGGFDEFDVSNVGVFFSSRYDIAASYAGTYDDVQLPEPGAEFYDENKGVYSAFLKFQNPMVLDWGGKDWGEGPEGLRLDDWANRAKRAGHDGLVVENVVDTGWLNPGAVSDKGLGVIYVAFKPEQIKSATDNDGTFDANDPSILSQDPAAPLSPQMALNDDIRRVMDRMLATDEQIAQANEVAGLVPDEAADGEAAERLRKRSIADLKWAVKARDKALAKLRKAAKGIEKEVRAQVTEEVNQRPEVQAKDALDKLRADKALDDASMAATADAFGFESPDAMLKAIAAFGSKAEAIDGMTEQRMLEEHGDLVDERAIAAAANEAVHNEARARSLATELRTQSEMLNARADTGQTNAKGSKVTVNVLMEAAKQFGANVAARTPLADVRAAIWRHTQAERRAAKRWQEATAAGKTEEAVKAKQDQTLQHAAARALIEAQDEVRKTLDFFKRVATGNDETVVKKGRDADIVNAARAVLAAYGVETPTTQRADDYLDVIKQNDPETYAAIAPMVDEATRNAQPLRALTVGELQALSEQIGALWYLAKRSRQMEIGGDLLDIDDLATQLNGRMEEIGIPDTVPGEAQAVTKREARALFIRQGLSFLKRVEQWAEGMDGRYGGPFLRYVFQPIKAAADAYRADRTAYRKKLEALVSNLAPIVGDKTIDAPELGYTFGGPDSTKGVAMNEVLHALLHTGNESNKRKLLLGRQWATENADGTLDTSRWDSFIQRLVATGKLQREHFDFVQGVWDLLEETKPLARKAHRDAFGRYFAEVTAAPFVDPFGVPRKGGYVPAMVDPALVKDNALRKIAEAENESMSYAFPQPGKGFTMSRVEGYNRALMLDLRTIGQHLDKVLLFSRMTVPARSVRRLVTHKAVSQPLDRIDPTALEVMLQPWLQRSAQQVVETPIPGSGGWARVPSIIRARAGMALMFANVSNAIQQATGLSTAMVKVKPGFIMRAMAQHVAHPGKAAAAVWEASSYMNDRAKNEVAVLNENMRDILLDPSPYEKAQAWSQRHAYFLQTAIDNALSPIVWTGAYNQAMADGMTHDDAVAFADGTVRQTQGSTLPEDVSRFETGPAYARAFTQFIGYFNMVANTNVVAIKQIVGEMGLKRGAGRLFSVVMLGMMVPIWAAEAIAQAFKGGPDDEDKDGLIVDDWLAAVFGFGTAKGLLAMVPIVGQAANSAVTRLDNNPMNDRISLSPGLSLIESAAGGNVQTVAELFNPDKDVNARRAVRDAASLVSIATGLPLYAIARPAGYAAGVAQGKIEPTGPVDAARGLITGTPSPESKVR